MVTRPTHKAGSEPIAFTLQRNNRAGINPQRDGLSHSQTNYLPQWQLKIGQNDCKVDTGPRNRLHQMLPPIDITGHTCFFVLRADQMLNGPE